MEGVLPAPVLELIYNYSKRRKMKLSFRKMVGALLGIDGIKKHCRF